MVQHTHFVAPETLVYPPPYPAVFTDWLFSDPLTNPAAWNRRELWPSAGSIKVVDQTFVRSVTIGTAAPFTDRSLIDTFDLDIAKGARALVFSRVATVGTWGQETQPTGRVPTQALSQIHFRQSIKDGLQEVEAAPLSCLFGTAVAPFKFPVPFMWDPRLKRVGQLAAVGNSGSIGETVEVKLTFKIAYLFTGR